MEKAQTVAYAALVIVLGIAGGASWHARSQDGEGDGKKKDGATPKKTKGGEKERFTVDKAQLVFDDGDTFKVGEREVRMLGVDAPETIHEQHGIFENQPGGPEAAEFTKKSLSEAKEIVIIVADAADKYGRLLSHVLVDGELLAVKMIRAGHGWETIGHYGDNGFPDYAQQILDAAKETGKPSFEEPWRWRRAHQKKTPKKAADGEKKDGGEGDGDGEGGGEEKKDGDGRAR